MVTNDFKGHLVGEKGAKATVKEKDIQIAFAGKCRENGEEEAGELWGYKKEEEERRIREKRDKNKRRVEAKRKGRRAKAEVRAEAKRRNGERERR